MQMRSDENLMNFRTDNSGWERLSLREKNHQLYLKQKNMLDMFLEHGAISREQHDKSLHDLTVKMGEAI